MENMDWLQAGENPSRGLCRRAEDGTVATREVAATHVESDSREALGTLGLSAPINGKRTGYASWPTQLNLDPPVHVAC